MGPPPSGATRRLGVAAFSCHLAVYAPGGLLSTLPVTALFVMLFAERRLSRAKGDERAWLARDSYSYLHLPMVAGIIFAALGIKEILAHVEDPLGTVPAVALCGGVALYLLGHNAFRLRDDGSVSVPRLMVAILCGGLVSLAVSVPSLITLAILAMLLCALVAFETMRSREFRRELRAR